MGDGDGSTLLTGNCP